MTRRDDSEEVDLDEDEAGQGWLPRILIVALLVGAGSASAYVWKAAGGPSLTSLFAVTPPAAQPQADLEVLRQQIASLTQSSQQMMAAQQLEINRLAEQVAGLSAKLDLWQRPVVSTPISIPVLKATSVTQVTKKRIGALKPPATAKPAESKLVDTRPTGAVSTGGTPLQLTR